MLNRKFLLISMIVGSCTMIKPFDVEEESTAVVVYDPDFAGAQPDYSKQVALYGKTRPSSASKGSQKSAELTQQLEDAQGDDMLCPVAAMVGRGLRVLPKAKGPINKKMLEEQCGDYFLGKNDEEKMHPQAYAAVTGFKSMNQEAVEQHATMAKVKKSGGRQVIYSDEITSY